MPRKRGKRIILFYLYLIGNIDIMAHETHVGGRLEDHEYPPEDIKNCWQNYPR